MTNFVNPACVNVPCLASIMSFILDCQPTDRLPYPPPKTETRIDREASLAMPRSGCGGGQTEQCVKGGLSLVLTLDALLDLQQVEAATVNSL